MVWEVRPSSRYSSVDAGGARQRGLQTVERAKSVNLESLQEQLEKKAT